MFCVSQSPGKRLTIRHKKGVRIVFLSYPVFRSWLTYCTDKMTAPHRFAIYSANHSRVYAINVGVIVIFLRAVFRRPSLNTEDKISITPFRQIALSFQSKN